MYQLEMVSWRQFVWICVHNIHDFHFQSLNKAGIDLAYSIFCFLVGVSWTLLLCYHATYASESTTDTGHHVYRSNWYLYPIFLRKYLLLLIAKTQQPMLFSGFQIVGCTLLTFTTVKLNLFFVSEWSDVKLMLQLSAHQVGNVLLYHVQKYVPIVKSDTIYVLRIYLFIWISSFNSWMLLNLLRGGAIYKLKFCERYECLTRIIVHSSVIPNHDKGLKNWLLWKMFTHKVCLDKLKVSY